MHVFNSPARADGARASDAPLSPAILFILFAAAVPIAVLSLAAHDLALTKLGVPYPDDHAVPSIVSLIGQIIRICALAALCRCAAAFLDRRGVLAAAFIVGVVNSALYETLRVTIITNQIYGGGWGNHLLYSVTDRLPFGLLAFYQGVAAVLIARFAARLVSSKAVISAAIAAAIGMYALSPMFNAAMATVNSAFHIQEPTPVYGMPFGLHMYRYIYATFLEPTLASLFLAFMVWPGLSGGRMRRIGQYTTLVLLARGRVFAILVNTFWLKYPLLTALAAEAQFFAETLIFAVLTGLVWDWAWRRRLHDAERPPTPHSARQW